MAKSLDNSDSITKVTSELTGSAKDFIGSSVSAKDLPLMSRRGCFYGSISGGKATNCVSSVQKVRLEECTYSCLQWMGVENVSDLRGGKGGNQQLRKNDDVRGARKFHVITFAGRYKSQGVGCCSCGLVDPRGFVVAGRYFLKTYGNCQASDCSAG